MELVQIGRILGPHGLGGHVQVISTAVPLDLLEGAAVWSVGFASDAVMSRRVEECRRHVTARGVSLVVRLDGVVDRTGAELLKGASVYSDEAEVVPSDTEGAEEADWCGYTVADESGAPLGTLVGRLPMPAHDVLLVQRLGRPDVMVPYVAEIVIAVDPERRLVTVNPPEGLFD